jgi:opacity protein-like surface antigen
MSPPPFSHTLCPRAARHWLLFGIFLTLPNILCLKASETGKARALQDIQQRVEAMRLRMQDLGGKELPKLPPLPPRQKSESNQPVLNNISRIDSYPPEVPHQSTPSNQDLDIPEENPKHGFYFLPFAGFSLSKEMKLPISNDLIISLKENVGWSAGLRGGYKWDYFYLEERISFNRSRFKDTPIWGTAQATNIAVKGISLHQALGFKIPLGYSLALNLGAGLGMTKQEISMQMDILGPISEDDWIFSYDALLGFEIQLNEDFLVGANYRWMHFDKLDGFSERDLHLLELSLGVKF